jgi:hypothetical protein
MINTYGEIEHQFTTSNPYKWWLKVSKKTQTIRCLHNPEISKQNIILKKKQKVIVVSHE